MYASPPPKELGPPDLVDHLKTILGIECTGFVNISLTYILRFSSFLGLDEHHDISIIISFWKRFFLHYYTKCKRAAL